MIRPALVAALAVTAVPDAALAQCPQSRGPFVGAPFGFSVEESAAGTWAGGEFLMKDHGFYSTPSTWRPQRGQPDWRLEVLLRSCGGTPPFPDADATSLGEDWVVADDRTGQVPPLGNRWAAITVSVTPGTRGRPGSVIRRETGNPGRAGSDVFSYVLPGSDMPAELVDATERAQDATEFGLGTTPQNVDALDQFVHQRLLDAPFQSSLITPARWFFSFSSGTLGRVPANWWGGTTPSGATIFQAIWSTTGAWSCPRVFKTYADLGLNASEDVDAIAVDLRNQRLLFSTTTPSRDPLLFLYCGRDGVANPVPYSDAQGTPISQNIGLIEDDELDAVCAMDPASRAQTGGPRNAFAWFMGSPRPRSFGLPGRIEASAFRLLIGGQVHFRTRLVGWPRNAAPAHGLAALAISLPNAPLPLLPIVAIPRVPGNTVCGDPISYDIPIPAALNLSGGRADLRWFALDNVGSISEAFPIQVRL